MWATTRTVTLVGAVGHVIDVQVDLSNGKIRTAVVGRAAASVHEGIERCRSAVDNSGLHWPTNKRITILLSPADLPKRGTHLDLAIAVGVAAAADDEFPREVLEGTVLIGELSLDGRLRSVPGVLPMVMAARANGCRRVIVPEPHAGEAALVEGIGVFGVRSLGQTIAVLLGLEPPDAPPVEPPSGSPVISWRGEERLDDVDLRDVRGMADARFALEVAAAGGHHLMLTGPKGAGKTTLAERLPTILPDLGDDEALEVTAVYSLAGALRPGAPVMRRPPFRAPHHTASRPGILGGGTGRVRPGEVSKAHLGVLFLDEFPLLPVDVVEALRQPLESGEITIARGEEEATYPARGMLVLACNPCPCGDYNASTARECGCGEIKRREYRRKLTGPIADRIDITRTVDATQQHHTVTPLAEPESSATVLARVSAARERQRARYAGTSWRINGHVPGPVLRESWPLTPPAMRTLDHLVTRGRLTRRGATRVHRVAWSLADLWGVDLPGVEEVDVAVRLRTQQPLDVRTIVRRAVA